jgi:hypothetical protein
MKWGWFCQPLFFGYWLRVSTDEITLMDRPKTKILQFNFFFKTKCFNIGAIKPIML